MALRRSWIAVLTAILLVAALLPPTAARALATKPLTITITKVRCVDDCRNDGLEDSGESAADFYAKVFINGAEHRTPRGAEDQELIEPYWAVTQQVDENAAGVPVAIQIWDHDSTSGDDLGDTSPRNDDNTLDFTVNYADGRWSGDVNWPQSCATGDGDDDDEPRVEVCFDVSTTPGADADGDGLLDGWERNGYNADGDGTIDVDLPAMGADVNHKDLFLELDYEQGRNLSKEDVTAMKAAFAAAPMNAGTLSGTRGGVSAQPNPDGTRGINLHVDMGNLADATLREGTPAGTCHDGLDNGADGLTDGRDTDCLTLDGDVEDPGPGNCQNNADDDGDGRTDDDDPDCLIGDPLGANGRGNMISGLTACDLDAAFYAAKDQMFDKARRLIFRYGISANPDGCTDAPGGSGEYGGNDFIDFNNNGVSVMHELGHTLFLDHGGFEEANCKPNYVSIMNYFTAGAGIGRQGGGRVLDYSPPRIAFDGATRGNAPLANLVENQLNENVIPDGADPVNRFVFVNGAGRRGTHDLDARPDWNGDRADPPFDNPVIANIDTAGLNGEPVECMNGTTDGTLRGSDDWSFISLPFRQFGDSANAPVNRVDTHEPTTARLDQIWRDLNTTDLSVAVTDSPDPVAAGTELTYTVTAANAGDNPATSVRIVDTLPADVTYTGGSSSCTASGATVTCNLGELAVGASARVTLRASVPAGLVHANGGPKTLTNRAVVSNLAGPDPTPANNEATATTRVVAVADLSVTALQADAPSQILIGQTLPVTVTGTVANGGPSTPMNATLTTAATASTGATITPASVATAVAALAAGSPRTIQKTVTIGCAQPGPHTYTVTGAVAPAGADDSDPTPANNQRQTTFTVDCIVPIAINIVPGLNPNLVNLAHGVVPVAALTTRAGEYNLPLAFDATKIKPETVRFGTRNGAAAHGAPPIHNIGVRTLSIERGPLEIFIDLDWDMLMTFTAHDTDLTRTSTEACLAGSFSPRTGETYRFFGCDAVRMFP
ncbi:hypothetical protein Acor_47030 [Acrocarpospora corrugata]|uniref:DUF11 domain-containing protein n=1 Tax=Acrocarpospora corrugata TaxID=35763 RepID=A0A5M3W0J2_9ACTN|nr:DUF11 domain-containing protein [Acrocarpospora corrugata]GES02637.1 hypothetical protein Acor_47030 [Acrocarpospora corrugata]